MAKKVLFVLIQIVFMGLLTFLGYKTLFPIETMEAGLYKHSFSSWYVSPILARITIGLLVIAGILNFIHIKNKLWNVIVFALVCLVCVDAFFLERISFSQAIFKYPFEKTMFTTATLISYLLSNYFKPKSWGVNSKTKYLIYFAGLLIIIPFILNPVYPSNFNGLFALERDTQQALNKFEIEKPAFFNKAENELVCFYSVTCFYCKVAAVKLHQTKLADKNFPNTKVIFWGDSARAERFLDITNTSFNYELTKDGKIFKELAGPSFPHFKWVEKGEIKADWTGGDFNYGVLEKLKNK